MKHLLPLDYALAAAEFRNYLAAGHPQIPVPGKHAMDVLYPEEDTKGRAFGQPLIASLYQFVLTLPSGERPKCAWDFPFARAMWLFFCQMETQGNYRIENFEERDEQSVMDDLKAERAGKQSQDQSPMSKVEVGGES